MPRTDDQINAAAASLEQRLDNLDLESVQVRATDELRAIAAAADAARAADAQIRERVQIARAHDVPWNRIAVALGVSRQAAGQRVGGATPVPKAGEAVVIEGGSKTRDATARVEVVDLVEGGSERETTGGPHRR